MRRACEDSNTIKSGKIPSVSAYCQSLERFNCVEIDVELLASACVYLKWKDLDEIAKVTEAIHRSESIVRQREHFNGSHLLRARLIDILDRMTPENELMKVTRSTRDRQTSFTHAKSDSPL